MQRFCGVRSASPANLDLFNFHRYLNQQHINKSRLSDAEIIYGNIGENQEQMEIGELGIFIYQAEFSSI